MENETGALETRSDAGEGQGGLVRLWLQALALSDKDEEKWRKKAEATVERFRDETERKGSRFNILYASTMTLVPALYNSTPRPDVRRRFRDPDPVGKVAAQVLERGCSYTIDCSDLDETMQNCVFDSALVGRGVARVRYKPEIVDEEVAYEDVGYELTDWRDFRRGPGRTWPEVSWVAFRHRITREQAIKLNPKIGGTVNLDYVEKGADKDGCHDIFKRLTVWEIWDKEKRQVVFLAPSHKDEPLKVADDPLGLKGFFPCPRPLYDVEDTNSLVPMVPYSVYKDQAIELDRITDRINALINVIKWRGMRGGLEEFGKLADADDGELVPVQNWQQLVASGGIEKSIWLMPIREAMEVVTALYAQREALKQAIFELTGVADIMRGQTDADETLGAQQIKAQWGSLRMQQRQKDVQRFARDLIRMTAELISEKFAPESLSMMTGIKLPSQMEKQQAQFAVQQAQQTGQPPEAQQILAQPTWDDIMGVLKNDASRLFRIDIETDSTIEADQLSAQKNMGEFVQGFGTFITAIGPAVETGAIPMDTAKDLLLSFSRQFKLGRQAEDAIERMAEAPQPQRPDPNAAAKAEAEAKAKSEQDRLLLDGKNAEADRELRKYEIDETLKLKREEAEAKVNTEREKMIGEHGPNLIKQMQDMQAVQVEMQAQNAQMMQALMQAMGQMSQTMMHVVQAVTAPKRAVRDPSGRLQGVETVMPTMQ